MNSSSSRPHKNSNSVSSGLSNAGPHTDRPANSVQGVREQIFMEQDRALDDLARVTARLGETATVINVELQDQQRLLHELDIDMDRQREKMNFVIGKLGKLLKTNDTKQLVLILALFIVAVFVFMLNILV